MSDHEWAQLMDLSMTAGMNVRYWSEIEFGLHLRAGLFAGFAVSFAVLCGIAARFPRCLPVALLSLTAALIVMRTMPNYHGAHPGSFRQSWENLRRDCDAAIAADDFSRYAALFERKERINSWEPPADRELLVRSLEAEEKARWAEADNGQEGRK